MYKILALIALALPLSSYAADAQEKEPFVFYHANSKWDGYPTDKTQSGWNAVLTESAPRGANTGVLGFLMHWDAKKQCWGVDRDCRSPAWAVSQHMSYVGTIKTNYFVSEIKQ